jgi:Putative DNA-binding HTH domain
MNSLRFGKRAAEVRSSSQNISPSSHATDGGGRVAGELIVTTLPPDSGASVPFIGLAEAHALAAIRGAGAPL